jgi:uncharacterized protein (TIGR03437 family)
MRPLPQILFLLVCSAPIPAQVNVLTANYGIGRTNANLQETQLTAANVTPGSFGKLGSFPVDGQIFAQPLYVSSLGFPNQATHNVLYVATEHNSVYAFDADSAASPSVLWHVNLGPSVPSSMLMGGTGPFTDVSPEIGILGTPTIDLQAGVLYVVAETLESGQPSFQLHALDLVTGRERMNGPVTIAATVPGTGRGTDGSGHVLFDASLQLQRPGLLLLDGVVSVAFGSHGDYGAWHGWLIGYNAADLSRPPEVFQTTPNGQGGAIWQSGRGLTADDAGNIYFITGNGDYDGEQDFGESFVRLSGTPATISDWYTPANWQMLSDGDYDLSAGPALIPGTHQLIGADKFGNLYLVSGDSMGHLDPGGAARVFQAIPTWIFNFALWPRSNATYVYVQEDGGPLSCFQITASGFGPDPVSASSPISGGSRGGMTISANGGQGGSGILWETTGKYNNPATPAVLHAFDAANLNNELWNSAMSPADALDGFAKFVGPTVANGVVYTASTGAVVVYGLLNPARNSQHSPSVAAVANAASYAAHAISPGEVVTIFGSDLGPASAQTMQFNIFGHLARDLSNTRVLFDGVPAPLVYAGLNQVSAIVPFALPSSASQVQVEFQGQTSPALAVPVLPATPGLFSADGSGAGQALAIDQDGGANGSARPASSGDWVVLYATGFGQTSPAGQDGAVVDANILPQPLLPVTARIGGQPAPVLYAGGAPGVVSGVMQVNVRIPAGVPTGPAVPVTLQVGSQTSQPGVTVAIR